MKEYHMDDVLCAAMAKYVNPNIVAEPKQTI